MDHVIQDVKTHAKQLVEVLVQGDVHGFAMVHVKEGVIQLVLAVALEAVLADAQVVVLAVVVVVVDAHVKVAVKEVAVQLVALIVTLIVMVHVKEVVNGEPTIIDTL